MKKSQQAHLWGENTFISVMFRAKKPDKGDWRRVSNPSPTDKHHGSTTLKQLLVFNFHCCSNRIKTFHSSAKLTFNVSTLVLKKFFQEKNVEGASQEILFSTLNGL